MEPHDTPVDTPALSPELLAWQEQAQKLKADGWNGSVVASKLVRELGAPEDVAVAVTSAVFGKKVDPRAGDTTTALTLGIVLIAAGLGGCFLWYALFGFTRFSIVIYLALLGVAGKGLSQVIITMVNSSSKEDLNES